jgi:hypothetical protein
MCKFWFVTAAFRFLNFALVPKQQTAPLHYDSIMPSEKYIFSPSISVPVLYHEARQIQANKFRLCKVCLCTGTAPTSCCKTSRSLVNDIFRYSHAPFPLHSAACCKIVSMLICSLTTHRWRCNLGTWDVHLCRLCSFSRLHGSPSNGLYALLT